MVAMEIELKSKPKPRATIVAGFPGFGFVATIATEFLLEHLEFKPIGKLWSEDMAPMAFVRKAQVRQPLEIFYNEKHNLVLLEAFSNIHHIEWELAEALLTLSEKINAKEIISFEGLQSADESEEPEAYYISNVTDTKKKLDKMGIQQMKEGIVIGVTGALMLKGCERNTTFMFATTHSKLPDSRAAAKIVEVFGKYLGYDLDIKPLLKKADTVESKLKDIISQAKKVTEEKQKRVEATEYIR